MPYWQKYNHYKWQQSQTEYALPDKNTAPTLAKVQRAVFSVYSRFKSLFSPFYPLTLIVAQLKEKDKEISRLKKEYVCNENYKQKYEDALLKIKELEMQLEESYSMNLPTSL